MQKAFTSAATRTHAHTHTHTHTHGVDLPYLAYSLMYFSKIN